MKGALRTWRSRRVARALVSPLKAVPFLVAASCVAMSGTSGANSDVSAFAVVVKHELARLSGPIRVDPRPLRNDKDIIVVTEAVRAPATANEMAARRFVIRSIGVAEGDATLPANCAGSETPSPDPALRRGCPPEHRNVIAVGLPLAGDVTTDSLPAALTAPRWSVRVIFAEIDPGGVAYFAIDYVLEERNGRLSFLKRRMVGVRE